ncbi:leucine-rich repeat domain-containing protein [Candidatus Poriferisodalis sp.]|uniref:leucine-rich repeat domain-containing protein n=1 Tax=Candidatus Poriferisodalis sp. TaxID=3101277 RepID=UPI003B0221A0
MLRGRFLRACACIVAFVALLPASAAAVNSPVEELSSSALTTEPGGPERGHHAGHTATAGDDPVPAQQSEAALISLASVTDLEGEWRAPGVVSLDWGDVPDADGYEVIALVNGQWLLLDANGDVDGVVVELDGSSALVAGLPPDAEAHWFAVRARNAESLAPWSHSVEVEVPESTASSSDELASFDPFTTPTRSGIDLERLRESAATVTPGDANCDSAPALDVAGVTVVDPPASLADADAVLTVAEVVRIAWGCLVVEYVELAGRTADQVRELLADEDTVFAVGVPPRGAQVAHDDGAHAPHTDGHHNETGLPHTEEMPTVQWHLPQPTMNRLWADWKSENPVTVAVLDTGVDEGHPDLDDQIVTGGLDSCHRVGATPHGTLMAGIIAAEHARNSEENSYVAGVAPDAKLLPIQVTDPSGLELPLGCSTVMPLTAAVATAVNHGARVISASLSTPLGQSQSDDETVGGVEISSEVTDDTFELALRAAAMLGVVSVASAGNCGDGRVVGPDDEGRELYAYEVEGCSRRDELRRPGAFSLQGNAIAVGAVDETGERRASSSANESLDVAAPGGQVLSTTKCTTVDGCGTGQAGGTSAAAAYVSGVVAHMLNRHPGATVGQVRAALEHSAIEPRVPDLSLRPVPSRTPRGREGDDRIVPRPTREFGRGIVDPADAVAQLGRLLLAGVTPKGPHGGFVQVTAGSEHACGLRASGQVLCWGASAVASETPVFAFASLSSAPTVGYVCGIRIDGAVQCWGDVPAALTTAVAGSGTADAPEGKFVEIAVGDAHVCGLRPDRGVVCWGDNTQGQTEVPFDRFGSEPEDRAKTIVAGAAHTCAVTNSSDLVCWGDDGDGRLPPATLPWAVLEVAAGAAHTCVVNVSSNIFCWGDSTYGQLSAPGGEFAGIAAGAHHTCAREAGTDSVTCWGRNSLGQNDAPTGRFARVSAGEGHSCALGRFASVTCWGDDALGKSNPAELATLTLTDTDSGLELLTGGFVSDTFEYTVQAVADAVRANWTLSDAARLGLEVAAFDDLGNEVAEGGSVFLTPGAVLTIRVSSLFGFGPERVYTVRAEDPPSLLSLSVRAETGESDCPGAGCLPYELMPGFDSEVLAYRVVVPSEVGLVTVGHTAVGGTAVVVPADADSAVGGHQVALTSSSGFGSMDAGNSHSCGLLTGGSVRCWGGSYPMVTAAPSGVFFQVSVGWGHACALTSSGSVDCWGDNYFGQSRPSAGSFAAVSAGWGHSCGLTTGGSARCWGYNFSGQSRPPSGTYSAVAAGGNHSCGILSSGSLSCWGLNNDGQARPPSGTFTALSAGWRHNCAVKDDATVACWGENDDGKSRAPSGSFTAVSAGEEHSCGLKTDGSVVCWGDNGYGQSSPPSGSFTSVSAGEEHSCALNATGTVICWGSTSAAQPALRAELTITVSSSVASTRSTQYTVAIDRGDAAQASGATGKSDLARSARSDIAGSGAPTTKSDVSDDRSAPDCSPAMVQFVDPVLRAGVEAALGKSAGDPITVAEMSALTELRLPRLDGSGSDAAITDLGGLEAATALRVLDLSGHGATDLAPLACLASLETLVLSANPVEDISALADMSSLRVLWLDRTGIDDISGLGSLTALERLYVYGNEISDISPVGSLTALVELYADFNDITDVSSLSSLSALTGLETLGLGGNDIADISALGGLVSLEDLYLFDNDIAAIGPLGPVLGAGVESVWLSGNQIVELPAKWVAGSAGYRYLDVRFNELVDVAGPFAAPGVVHSLPQRDTPAGVVDGVLAAAIRDELGLAAGTPLVVGRVAMLEQLDYRGSDDAGRIVSLAGLEHAVVLGVLDIADNRVTDISPVSGLAVLAELDLYRNGFTDLAQLAGMDALRELRLLDNGITSLAAMPALEDLEYLSLSFNDIGDLSPLAALTGLERLAVVAVGAADITPLAGLTSLRSLQIGGNPLHSIDTLAALTSLEHLRMSGVGHSDLTPVAGLANLATLVTVDNDHTSIEPLRNLTGLRNLLISRNSITSLEPLRGLTRLRHLEAADNQIGDISALSASTAMWHLNIADNQIADISVLEDFTALLTLDLAGNHITDFTPIDNHTGLTVTGRNNQTAP